MESEDENDRDITKIEGLESDDENDSDVTKIEELDGDSFELEANYSSEYESQSEYECIYKKQKKESGQSSTKK